MLRKNTTIPTKKKATSTKLVLILYRMRYTPIAAAARATNASAPNVRVIALVTTAAFAFLAAVAAIVSAVIFSGQLGEMHQASIDTTELVDTARDTEERQLRAYLSITGYIELRCHSCNAGQFRPISPAPQYMMDNIITINIQNGGQTPAYNVYVEDSFYPATFEGSLPSGFAFPIIKPTEHMVSASRSSENGVGTINAHEITPNPGPIQQSILDYIIRAQHHNVTLFYYGNIRYTDIFHKTRITPFCMSTFQICPLRSNSQHAMNTIPHQKMDDRARTARLPT